MERLAGFCGITGLSTTLQDGKRDLTLEFLHQ
jgi:hypothetical protein